MTIRIGLAADLKSVFSFPPARMFLFLDGAAFGSFLMNT